MKNIFKKYVGDRAFYRSVLAIAVPIIVQSAVTNFVNLLDNIMVGSLSTESLSGVSIANQYVFVFTLLIFGAVSAAGIFTAQYQGSKDVEGVRQTFRIKLLAVTLCTVAALAVFLLLDDELIGLFLYDGSAEGDLALTLSEGKIYLFAVLFSLLPSAWCMALATTMRETGETVQPMVASLVAVLTNFVLNGILIFGLLGAPALGVLGAAIATSVSKTVELLYLLVYGLRHTDKFPWLSRAFFPFSVSRPLLASIVKKSLSLMLNEFMWGLSVIMTNRCYATRGLESVAALAIASTVLNLFNVIYINIGTTISILVGNQLGAGEIEKAKDTDRKMIAFSVFCGFVSTVLVIGISPVFPLLYNTTDTARGIATYMMIVFALVMPIDAFANASYFTLRTGGLITITVLFDSVFKWVVVYAFAYVLATFTPMNIFWLFALSHFIEAIKIPIGGILLKKTNWAKKIVREQ